MNYECCNIAQLCGSKHEFFNNVVLFACVSARFPAIFKFQKVMNKIEKAEVRKLSML